MNTLVHKIYNRALNTPNKIALIAKKKSFSYKELFENIWASKELLEIEYDISKGDIVILAANKNVAFVFNYFALHLIGATVMPIDEKINHALFYFLILYTLTNNLLLYFYFLF